MSTMLDGGRCGPLPRVASRTEDSAAPDAVEPAAPSAAMTEAAIAAESAELKSRFAEVQRLRKRDEKLGRQLSDARFEWLKLVTSDAEYFARRNWSTKRVPSIHRPGGVPEPTDVWGPGAPRSADAPPIVPASGPGGVDGYGVQHTLAAEAAQTGAELLGVKVGELPLPSWTTAAAERPSAPPIVVPTPPVRGWSRLGGRRAASTPQLPSTSDTWRCAESRAAEGCAESDGSASGFKASAKRTAAIYSLVRNGTLHSLQAEAAARRRRKAALESEDGVAHALACQEDRREAAAAWRSDEIEATEARLLERAHSTDPAVAREASSHLRLTSERRAKARGSASDGMRGARLARAARVASSVPSLDMARVAGAGRSAGGRPSAGAPLHRRRAASEAKLAAKGKKEAMAVVPAAHVKKCASWTLRG